MKDEEIRQYLKENDAVLKAFIFKLSNELSQVVQEVIEWGTPEQKKAVEDMLKRNLALFQDTDK
jgi:hypothetical protein